ncbi:MAG: thioredoxin domain-containing protein [Gammaproteobacteria bacterium]|nr:thioredoxin domain-containing protein [Gammaproteobacteria bacterium]
MPINRLQDSTSPYLLQHANDPVHWQPWDTEALAQARAQNKPILLSIGYSACHWCHVMAHESFSDKNTAAIMNEHFVNIKLDREERPDLDKIYQLTHQLLLQRPGGWPLTVFLTPDQHIPFFAGTYFPPEPRHGMPGFPELIQRIAQYFQNEGESIQTQGEQIKNFFNSFDQRELTPSNKLDKTPIIKALTVLRGQFDQQFGGFGGAPKFPFPSSLEFLLQQWALTAYDEEPDRQLLFMVSQTLQHMARGGLYDQIRGGFYRYSVDQAWMIPHFEKMLYDNAQLIPLYAQLFQISGEPFYREIVSNSIEWLVADMQHPNRAFYATLDADSEGVEGKFYVWSREELESVLDFDDLHLLEQHYNIAGSANFEGHYHLHQIADVAALAENTNTPREQIQNRINLSKQQLLEVRNRRVRPQRDNKLLTAWNALLARGLSISGRILESENIKHQAFALLHSIKSELDQHGNLRVQMGEHSHPKHAFIDEYAFTLDAILEALQNNWDTDLLLWACDLADVIIKEYQAENGGFYYTAHSDEETLLYRPLTFSDDALPSGNAVAIKCLLRLGYLLGNPDYLQAAEKALNCSYLEMDKSPQAHASLLTVLDEYLEPGKQFIIRGESADIDNWKNSLQKLYSPKTLVFAIPNHAENLPDALSSKVFREISVAYVCEGTMCSAAIHDLESLIAQLVN